MATPVCNIARGDKDGAKDYYNTINLVKVPPIVIDSHMHIMSGHCTPLPLIWNSVPRIPVIVGKTPSSKKVDSLGTKIGALDDAGKWSTWKPSLSFKMLLYPTKVVTFPIMYLVRSSKVLPGQLAVIAKKGTLEIGEQAVKANENTYRKVKEYKNNENFFSIMITMPMDMEYAHYAGFEHFQIYYKAKFRWYNDKTIGFNDYYPPTADEIDGGDQMSKALTDGFKEIREKKEKKAGKYFNKRKKDDNPRYFVVEHTLDEKTNKITKNIIWLNTEEIETYVPWKKQEIKTRFAAAKKPWKLIPMYHFEPRRYRKSKYYQGIMVTPTQAGMYIGFKMYPSLGYNPGDFDRITGLRDFYTFCNNNKLPILSHCSPAGMPTHERPLYYHEDKKAGRTVDDIIAKHDKERYKQSPEEFYFSDSYVAPKNWIPVLNTYKDLRLCLAHFGGSEKGFSRWGKANDAARNGDYGKNSSTLWDQQIIDMIKDFKNCFVDISYFYVKNNFKHFKDLILKDDEENDGKDKIRNKILFGTDWYLIEQDQCTYKDFYKNTRKQLDKIDESLWIRFSCLNPMRFFGLDKETTIDNLAKGMLNFLKGKSNTFLWQMGILSKDIAKDEILKGKDKLKKIDIESYSKFIGYPENE